MTRFGKSITRCALAGVIGLGAFLASDFSQVIRGDFVSRAEARIGRPLTPLSYAGVARRTTRRAVAAGVGGVVVGGPRCVRVADAYGRVIVRCY